MKQLTQHEDAFTGIEAAIIFIAFITVASVFTYIMLGTGFFTTQVSQKVVNAGVQGASSNVIVVGDILGMANSTLTGIDTVEFGVTLSAGAAPVNFTSSQMIISKEGSLESLDYKKGQWSVIAARDVNNDGVLSANEIWTIHVNPSVAIPSGSEFTLEVKPPGGASFNIRRTVPRGLDLVNILY